MLILVAAGEPFPKVMRDLIQKEFWRFRIPTADESGVYVDLSVVVIVRFWPLPDGLVVQNSKSDLSLCIEVTAELMKRNMVKPNLDEESEDQKENSTPTVEIMVPEDVSIDELKKWAKAIVAGVRSYLLKRQQYAIPR